jgi:hypothetical protein
VAKALGLFSARFNHPAEGAEWLLSQFNGWDLEAIIERLKDENNNRAGTK